MKLKNLLLTALTIGLFGSGIATTPANAAENRACDPEGPTAQDLSIGRQLNTQLDKDMRGGMDAYETSCARVVVETVKKRGLTPRAAAIAISTVIVESHLNNVNYGDRDSLGLYQQRAGWGTAAQRLHAPTATNKFLDVMEEFYPNNRWATAPIGEVAADVQRPAAEYRGRYAVQAPDAVIIANALWNVSAAPSMPGMTAVSRSNDTMDVFAATTDGLVKHRFFPAGTNAGCWTTLPSNARIKGEPAAIVTPGRIDVFALGIDNRLKRATWTVANDGWYNWIDMGTETFTSAPALTKRSDTGIDVFAKNGANRIQHRHFITTRTETSGWYGSWNNIGGNFDSTTFTSGPAAVASPDGSRMNVLARGADGHLTTLMWTEGHGWWNWVQREDVITGKPSAISRGGNGVSIFYRSHGDALLHKYTADGNSWTQPVQGLGGNIYTSPAAVSMNPQRIDVFSRNNEADLVRKTWSTSEPNWYPWVGHGAIGGPVCGS